MSLKYHVRRNNKYMADSVQAYHDGYPTVLDDVTISFGRQDNYNVSHVDYAKFSVVNNNQQGGVNINDYIEILVSYPTDPTPRLVNTFIGQPEENKRFYNMVAFSLDPSVEQFAQYYNISNGDEVKYKISFNAHENITIDTTLYALHFDGTKTFIANNTAKNNQIITVKVDDLPEGNFLPLVEITPNRTNMSIKNFSGKIKNHTGMSFKKLSEFTIDNDNSYMKIKKTGERQYVKMFEGYVDNTSSGYDIYNDRDNTAINCVSPYVRLQSRMIGDRPFPTQTVQERINTISTLLDNEYTFIIPKPIRDIRLMKKDIDNTSVARILEEIAKSTDTVIRMVDTEHIYFEKVSSRIPRNLIYKDSYDKWQLKPNSTSGTQITNDEIKANIKAVKSNNNMASVIKVSWKEEKIENDTPIIVEHYHKEQNTYALSFVGTKTLTITTELESKNQAQKLANTILARQTNQPTYENLTIHSSDVENLQELVKLLSPLSRHGKLLTINGVPKAMFSQNGQIVGYLENGQINLNKQKLTLNTNLNSVDYGKGRITFKDMKGEKIKNFSSLTFKDLYTAEKEQTND